MKTVETIFEVSVRNHKTGTAETISLKKETIRYADGSVKKLAIFQGNPFSGKSGKFFEIAEKFLGNYIKRGISTDPNCAVYVYEYKLH